MRTAIQLQWSARNMCVVLLAVGVLLSVLGAHPARAQSLTGDHRWNFRQDADDRFHANEAWVQPGRYNYDDGWGRWCGGYEYEIPWGSTGAIGNTNGSFTISRDRDHQFHAWTFVRVAGPKDIVFNGSGDCVPRAFLNTNFDLPLELPATLDLVDGRNRIDISGYNPNSGYTFSCDARAGLVDVMDSDQVDPNRPPVAEPGGPYVAGEGSVVVFDGSGSSDPDGDVLRYRWDFDNDGTWDMGCSSDPTALCIWGDNENVTVRLEVKDGALSTTAPAGVTIVNVVPAAAIDSVDRPNPAGILPNQVLTFTGSFSDPGWLDTHTCTWAFGDGAARRPRRARTPRGYGERESGYRETAQCRSRAGVFRGRTKHRLPGRGPAHDLPRRNVISQRCSPPPNRGRQSMRFSPRACHVSLTPATPKFPRPGNNLWIEDVASPSPVTPVGAGRPLRPGAERDSWGSMPHEPAVCGLVLGNEGRRRSRMGAFVPARHAEETTLDWREFA